MKKKNIFILLAVFAGLVIIAIIIEGPIGKRGQKKAAEESILFPGFEPDQVSSIEIKTKSKQVRLNKDNDLWVVATSDNYPADPEAMKSMLDRVKNLKSTHTASRSAEKQSQFEVDEGSGTEVKMMRADGKPLAHFFVGKMGVDFMSTYVRKASQDRILLVGEYLKATFDKGARGWRDRKIFSFDTSQVQRLTLISQEKGKTSIEAQEDGNWQIVEPEVAPAKKDEVNGIIRDISRLSADDFAEKKEPGDSEEEPAASPLSEYKLDEPQSRIMVDLKDGTARILLIGDASGSNYYVKREGKDTVFKLHKSKVDSFFKDLEELKAEIQQEEKPEGAEQETEEAKPDGESRSQEMP